MAVLANPVGGRRFICALIAVTALASASTPAGAQDQGTGDAIAAIESGDGLLSVEQTERAATLNGLRMSTIDLAAEIIATQQEINAIQNRIATLHADEQAALGVLDGQRDRFNRLVAGLQRLSRTPIEVWAVADGPSAELIRGALLLNRAMAPIEAEAENISETVADLADARALLRRERSERDAITAVFDEQMAELNRLVGDRQTTLEQLEPDNGAMTQRLSNVASDAESLGDLIDAIEDDLLLRALDANLTGFRSAVAAVAPAGDADARQSVDDIETFLPAAGTIDTEFGAEDSSGERAQGLTLTVAPASLIVAPVAGVVRYAGPFADSGLILILDHGAGYHSTIAGVGRLDVMAGQAVAAGEPVAVTALPQNEMTPTSTLFFEVRRNGNPVNPMTELVLAQGRGPE